jgi:hypothetical protein
VAAFLAPRYNRAMALSYVYVVGDDRAVKIGKSARPEARIGLLQTASSATLTTHYLGVTNGDAGLIEQSAHRLLRPYRLTGEWFSAAPSIAIAAVEQAAQESALELMRADDGRVQPDGRAQSNPLGYRAIWQSNLPLVHKLNLSALRLVSGVLLLGFVATVGIMVALAIQTIIIAAR